MHNHTNIKQLNVAVGEVDEAPRNSFLALEVGRNKEGIIQ